MRRTPEEIAIMRRAGKVVAEMHECIRAAIRPGVTTLELDISGADDVDVAAGGVDEGRGVVAVHHRHLRALFQKKTRRRLAGNDRLRVCQPRSTCGGT